MGQTIGKQFYHACKNNDTELALMLLNSEIDYYDELYSVKWAIEKSKHTAIYWIIQHNMIQVMNKMILLNKTFDKDNVLHTYEACTPNKEEMCILLIDNGYKYNTEITSDNILVQACNRNVPKVALKILNICLTEDIKQIISHYNSIMQDIYVHQMHDVINKIAKYLVGNNIIFTSSLILMSACKNNFHPLLIIDFCDDKTINYTDNNNDTPLIWACKNNLNDVALKIIDTGNTVFGKKNSSNNTALTYAVKNNMYDVIDVLINLEKYGYAYYYAKKNNNQHVITNIENMFRFPN